MNNILVSAIVSTYNSEKFIRRRIENLLEQTIADQLEIIVINSGSQENEGAIVKEFMKRFPQIKYIETKERETIYKAWNRGIRISEGKYITNANTDDLLRNDALEILSNILAVDTEVGLVYADQYITSDIETSFNDVQDLNIFYRLDYSPFRILWRNIVGPQPVWRASLHFDEDIWFDEIYEVSGDSEFEFRVSQKYKLLRVPKVLGIYYKSKNNRNKEFQDKNLSMRESLSVKEKNAMRYIEGLEKSNLKKIKWKISFNLILPRVLYSAFRIVIGGLIPSKQVPPRIFWYWLASLFYECRGNLYKARKCCENYARSGDHLIVRQIERLKG